MSWIQKRRKEEYYRKAKREGFKSRATYKLKQMDEKFSIIKNGNNIVDLGASPGGWSQYILSVNPDGINIALDLIPLEDIPGVAFIRGDIFNPETVNRMIRASPTGYDVVLSDILMHTTGDKSRDQANSYYICIRVLEICNEILKKNGKTVVKTIQGDLTPELKDEFSKHFRKVRITKPPSSLPSSPEVYILAEGHLTPPQAH